jgi:hypothetical protein
MPLSDEETLHGRQALYGALLSSLGATLGWLLWVAAQAVQRDPRVLLAPAFGAALGLAIDWLSHYVGVARGEASGQTTGALEKPALDWARPGALAVIFLAAACQNYVSDNIYAVVVPFLASLATLFPVGVMFGWMCCTSAPPEAKSVWELFWSGTVTGLLAALAAFVVHFCMGGVFTGGQSWSTVGSALWSLLGWWCLLGAALGLIRGLSKEPTVLGPVFGVVLALAVVFAFCLPAVYHVLNKAPGVLALARIVVEGEVNQMLSAPDLPAVFWEKAQKQLDTARPGPAAADKESSWGAAVAHWLGCPESGQVAAPPPQLQFQWPLVSPQPDMGRLLQAQLKKEEDRTEEDRQVLREWEEYQQSLNQANKARAGLQKALDHAKEHPLPLPDESSARMEKLCKELRRGGQSGLVRSWLVILMFSVGLGLSPLVERPLRPVNYRYSRTHRNDQALMKFMFVLVALVIGLIWLVRGG